MCVCAACGMQQLIFHMHFTFNIITGGVYGKKDLQPALPGTLKNYLPIDKHTLSLFHTHTRTHGSMAACCMQHAYAEAHSHIHNLAQHLDNINVYSAGVLSAAATRPKSGCTSRACTHTCTPSLTHTHTLIARQSAACGTCCAYFSANTYIIFHRFYSFFAHRILLPPFSSFSYPPPLLNVHVSVSCSMLFAPLLLFLILFALATL